MVYPAKKRLGLLIDTKMNILPTVPNETVCWGSSLCVSESDGRGKLNSRVHWPPTPASPSSSPNVSVQVLHEDVTAMIKLEDRSMEANQRMYREQRRDAMRDIGKFGERVIDTLMGSMLKQSSLRVDLAPNGGTGSIEDEMTCSQPHRGRPVW